MTEVGRKDWGPIEAVLFDVFGTLVDWRSSVARQIAGLAGRHGWNLDPFEVADAWRRRYGPSMDRVLSGERPWANLDALHAASLRDILAELGITPPGETIEKMVLFWHRLEPWPDSVAGLRRIRRKYVVATMSNGNVALLVDLAKHAGLTFDVILSAELPRRYKRDPQCYLDNLALLGRRPEQAMMVAAHPGELAAVAGLGMRTAFVARPWEYGEYREPALAPGQVVDLACSSLEQLADRLGA